MTRENTDVYARYTAALSRLPINDPTKEDLKDLCPYASPEKVTEVLKEFGRIACPPLVAGELRVLDGEFKDRLFGILGHKLAVVRMGSAGCLDDVPCQERAEDFARDNWGERLGENQNVNEGYIANVKFDAERMEDLKRRAARKGVKMRVFEADQGENYDPNRRYGMHIDQGPDLPTIILWAATWHLLMDDGGSRLDDMGNGGIVANDISSENIPAGVADKNETNTEEAKEQAENVQEEGKQDGEANQDKQDEAHTEENGGAEDGGNGAESNEESSSFENSDNEERGSGIGDSDTDSDPGDSGFDSGDSGFDSGGSGFDSGDSGFDGGGF